MKYLLQILFLLALYSCSENLSKEHTPEKYFGSYSNKDSRISIENGPRQGFQYFDSAGTEYSYRYITTTVTNDSVVPVLLKISFSKEYNYLRSNEGLKSKVFLLPRLLTPEKQHFDKSMSKQLKHFLDKEIDHSVSLDEIINPNEKLVITFGILTEMKYGDFMLIKLISSNESFHFKRDSIKSTVSSSKIYLGLDLVNSFIIPCGEISFGNK